ncbi:hypothetical protein DRB17_09190 [Ferruginivarius sediminum]|uniref:Uncharacterized protein n=2 Tax=Ferruginivarius sediminum TaxID=2661937 RepID=A0A369TBW5_9PROT|nr:hypothetical protein DRB17_09190 [Ferruginivarius sediminum]
MAAVIGVVAYAWIQMGDVEMSSGGILAMVGGVLVSLAVGIGLMALVFYSNRSGHDDDAGGH